MKFLVIGTGSIGSRHINNLRSLGVEASTFSYRECKKLSLKQGWGDIDNSILKHLDQQYDAVIVANSSELHANVAVMALGKGHNLFIEKPVSLTMEGVHNLVSASLPSKSIIECGFMLRTHPNLIWMKSCIDSGAIGKVMHLKASVGQWLPDWRPGTNYMASYSALKAKGGGVIFDLIHELDLVHWMIGSIQEVFAMTSHLDELSIETEAIAHINLKSTSGVLAQISMDYVRPGYERSLEVIGLDGVLKWDYLLGTVTMHTKNRVEKIVHRLPPSFDRNEMFLNHMKHFIDRLKSGIAIEPISSLSDGVYATKLAIAAHSAALSKKCVSV